MHPHGGLSSGGRRRSLGAAGATRESNRPADEVPAGPISPRRPEALIGFRLSGVKRTWLRDDAASAYDRTRTSLEGRECAAPTSPNWGIGHTSCSEQFRSD